MPPHKAAGARPVAIFAKAGGGSASTPSFYAADADAEIRQANDWLDAHCPTRRTSLFAYPYGESNDYLVEDYLPRHEPEHRLRAAFTTEPRVIDGSESVWCLPRFTCGHHWRSPDALAAILAGR